MVLLSFVLPTGTVYPMRDFLFRSDIVVKHGTKNFTESLSKQVSGLVGIQFHSKLENTIEVHTSTKAV